MKILVLGWEYPPAVAGGLGAACHGLTTALAARGHSIVLAVPRATNGGEAEADDAPGIERMAFDLATADVGRMGAQLSPYSFTGVTQARGAGSGRTRAAQALYGGELAQALHSYTHRAVEAASKRDFDVIHAHDWMTVPAATRLRLATRRPLCLHVHSTAFDRSGLRSRDERSRQDLTRRVESVGVRTADEVIAVSEYGKRAIQREYRADPRHVHVVHNAPPIAAPPIGSSKAGASVTPSDSGKSVELAPTVLFVGRLTRQKGAAFLLRAAKDVIARVPHARFVFAGEGEERQRLIELSASLGIASNVFFPGSISDTARDHAYSAATVFVMPSVSEPFGLTPLEALERGTPVILSKDSGVAEVLPSAPAIAPWDRAALSGEIVRVLEDESLRGDLVRRGRAEAATLDWGRSAAALERVLAAAAPSRALVGSSVA